MTTGKPLDELTEDELLAHARKAMSRAVSLPVGSLGCSISPGWRVARHIPRPAQQIKTSSLRRKESVSNRNRTHSRR